MITRSDDPYRGFKRTFRVALIVSLLIHPLLIALIAMHFDFRHPDIAALRKKQDRPETVTISSAAKKAPRAVAAVQPPPRHVVARPQPRPKVVAQIRHVPHRQEIANEKPKLLRKPHVVPTYEPPIPEQKELAKIVAHGTPVPLPAPTTARTPKPVKPPKQTPPPDEPQEKSVAYNEKSSTTQATQSKSARLAQQVAQINAELARDVRQQSSYDAAMSNARKSTVVPEAPKHYNINFSSVSGGLRGGEGLCDPIKSWTDDGWDYYYTMCNVVEADGSMNRKAMPWPVRWRPKDDPYSESNYSPRQGPMPMPPPGWKPDPAHPIDPDFVLYLRQGGYAI